MSTAPYEPLYQKIYNDIQEKIRDGVFVSGDKIPTEFELMEEYGVSRITAARALKELASDGYIRRMRKNGSIVIGREAEPEIAAALSEPASSISAYQHVPLVLPFSPDIGFDIMGGIQREAQRRNMLVTLFNSERQVEKERIILEQVADMSIDGLICLPLESYANLSAYTHLQAKGVPIVFVDRQLRYLDVPYVTTVNFHAMTELTQWLLDKGHRRIGYLAYDLNAYCENERFKGYVKALTDNGLELDSRCIAEVHRISNGSIMLPENDSDAPQYVRQCLANILDQAEPPTALMCSFDLLASYVEQQAGALGISIPRDLSVTGFDNVFIASHLEVPLTTMAQNYDAIGKKAIELLMAMQNRQPVGLQHFVDAALVQRDSVAPPCR